MLKVSADQLPRKHQYNGIDVFKLLCAFLIIVLHIKPFHTDYLGFDHLNYWIQNCVCRIAVPFYFTASGFLLFRKMDFSNIDNNRIKSYCFKILRLLGTWTFLLFIGGQLATLVFRSSCFSSNHLKQIDKKRFKNPLHSDHIVVLIFNWFIGRFILWIY